MADFGKTEDFTSFTKEKFIWLCKKKGGANLGKDLHCFMNDTITNLLEMCIRPHDVSILYWKVKQSLESKSKLAL